MAKQDAKTKRIILAIRVRGEKIRQINGRINKIDREVASLLIKRGELYNSSRSMREEFEHENNRLQAHLTGIKQ